MSSGLEGCIAWLTNNNAGPDKGEKGVEGFEEAFKDLGG